MQDLITVAAILFVLLMLAMKEENK